MTLFAAAAQIDITPKMGAVIGVDMFPTFVEHVHDRLYAKLILLKNQEITLAIYVIDICIMDSPYMDLLKQKIAANTDIKPENILLSSNHNHASGDVVGLLGGKVDVDYKNSLPDLLLELTQNAFKKLEPAKIGFGSVLVPEYVVSRRYLMDDAYEAYNPVTRALDKVKTNPFKGEKHIIKRVSEPDSEVCFFGIKTLEGKWVTILANYGLHYAADWPGGVITADFFGTFSKHIKRNLNEPENFVAMMSNGTSGDINIWDFMEPDRLPTEHFAKSELIGQTIAQKVFDSIPNIHWQENAELAVLNREINLAIRKPSPAEYAMASTGVEHVDFDKIADLPDAIQHIYDREQVLLMAYPDTCTLQLQVLKIGKIAIGALPGEFFAETGLALKSENSQYNYFSINLANSYGGYIPPKQAFEMGGYETWRARSSCMETHAEEKIRTIMNQMIKEI